MSSACLRFALLAPLWLVLAAPARAQFEFSYWHFGYRAALSFYPSVPVGPPLPASINSSFSSLEASASMSDSTGRLLCYTNGEQVWNRQDRPMPNGQLVGGCASAAQGALLLPRPGYRQQYFLFTLDCAENRLRGGLRYSIVDLALNGGLGDVAKPSSLQVGSSVLSSGYTEALTAVRHADGTHYWVVAHGWETNLFLCYPLLATGLGPPVLSRVGSVHGPASPFAGIGAYGSMRASPDGTRLAVTNPDGGVAELFAFDNQTGQISAPQLIPIALPVPNRPYGIEFSANGRLLYLTAGLDFVPPPGPGPAPGLFQVDVRAPGLPVQQIASGSMGALLRGLDDRIYVANQLERLPTSTLGVVERPNVPGSACQYVLAGVSLGTGRHGTGLPNFANRLPQRLRAARAGGGCLGEISRFAATAVALSPPAAIDSVTLRWDFGEPASGSANTATGPSIAHRYAKPGTCLVTLSASTASGVLEARLLCTVSPLPLLRIAPRDTLVCEAAGVLLQASPQLPGTSYRWQDGSTAATLLARADGQYWLEVQNAAGCTSRDTVRVVTKPCPVIIPTIITPNNDPYNQALVVSGLLAADWSLRVYNRWGREVYQQASYDNRWDAPGQPDGSYFYQLRQRTTGQVLKGWVEVRR
ncbi:gliding motility-associated C-terminal domain-containing protein [Hymenobacter sp. UYCo722]|uniref:T9SS type B sorting domain-containing protein n=1 Tax=Hymenobacter sp. UYCo722 TaxID=3156335 RepID=UPI003390934F